MTCIAMITDISDRLKATAKQSDDDADTNEDEDPITPGAIADDENDGTDVEDNEDDVNVSSIAAASSAIVAQPSSRLGLGLGNHRSSAAVPSSRAPRALGLGSGSTSSSSSGTSSLSNGGASSSSSLTTLSSSRVTGGGASSLLRGQLLARARQSNKGKSPRSASRSLATSASGTSSPVSSSRSLGSARGRKKDLTIQSSLPHNIPSSLNNDVDSPAISIAMSGRALFTQSSLEPSPLTVSNHSGNGNDGDTKRLDISVNSSNDNVDESPDDEWKTPVRSAPLPGTGRTMSFVQRPQPLRLHALLNDENTAPYSPKGAQAPDGSSLSLALTPKTSPTRDYSSPRRVSRSLRPMTPTNDMGMSMDGNDETKTPLSIVTTNTSSEPAATDEFEFLAELRAQHRLPAALMASPHMAHHRPRSAPLDHTPTSTTSPASDTTSPSIQPAKRRRMWSASGGNDDDSVAPAVDEDATVIAPTSSPSTSLSSSISTSSTTSSPTPTPTPPPSMYNGSEVSLLPPSPQQISACRRLVDLATHGDSPLSNIRSIAIVLQ
jgi:hypothetical protein